MPFGRDFADLSVLFFCVDSAESAGITGILVIFHRKSYHVVGREMYRGVVCVDQSCDEADIEIVFLFLSPGSM